MRYALVLWDFDGTLADTLGSVLEIFNELAPGFDLAPITDVQAIRDTMPLQFLRAHRIPLWFCGISTVPWPTPWGVSWRSSTNWLPASI